MKDVEDLREPLRRFIHGYVRDPDAAEDLAQETLLRVVRHRGRWNGRAAFRTWAFTIARNLCRDRWRSSRRLRLVETREPGGVDDPGERLEREEARRQVAEALGSLDADDRELLVLRLWQGLSYREIARRRGWPPSGVGMRLFRARQDLTRRLREKIS